MQVGRLYGRLFLGRPTRPRPVHHHFVCMGTLYPNKQNPSSKRPWEKLKTFDMLQRACCICLVGCYRGGVRRHQRHGHGHQVRRPIDRWWGMLRHGLLAEVRPCKYMQSLDFRVFFLFFFIFNLTYSRCTSLPSCLWSLRTFPSLAGSRLTIFHRDASSALLQLFNQWLNFTYSRSHAFRYGRKNTNPTLVRIELTTSALAGV